MSKQLGGARFGDHFSTLGGSHAARAGRLGLAALLLLVSACAVGSPVGAECESGADCESGACNDGVCIDTSADGGSGGTTNDGGNGGEDAMGGSGAGPADGGGPEGGAGGSSGLCSPGHEGIVSRDEIPLEAGLEAQFRVATDVTLSTAGSEVDGVLTWDLSTALQGDHTTLLETLPLAGTWYEATFPGATYASRLSESEDLLGVFELSDEALLLRGVVSPEDGLYRTELEYDPPVAVLKFPLQVGDTWTTDSTVSGYATGVYGVYFETYENSVDERGNVVTPFATFDSLRVRVDLTRTVGALVTTQKTFAFVTECFGTIATMNSQSGETDDEFSDLAEVRRLTP
ncbi:MAG: hypothetical protein HOW73_34820 [Polyangiaceae bacterium]|nr:hypothetical protein [Polyangiaceae bacterium]